MPRAVHTVHRKLHVRECCLFDCRQLSLVVPCIQLSTAFVWDSGKIPLCIALAIACCFLRCTASDLLTWPGGEIQDSAAASVRRQHWIAHIRQHLDVCSSETIKCTPDSDSRLQGVQLIYRQLANSSTTYTSTIQAPTGG